MTVSSIDLSSIQLVCANMERLCAPQAHFTPSAKAQAVPKGPSFFSQWWNSILSTQKSMGITVTTLAAAHHGIAPPPLAFNTIPMGITHPLDILYGPVGCHLFSCCIESLLMMRSNTPDFLKINVQKYTSSTLGLRKEDKVRFICT